MGVLPLAAGEVLLGPAVPGAGERLAVRELADAVETGPVPETYRNLATCTSSSSLIGIAW
jgi:hypothetical protein